MTDGKILLRVVQFTSTMGWLRIPADTRIRLVYMEA